MGPYLWPEVKKSSEKVKINISDRDFFLGLVPGDGCAPSATTGAENLVNWESNMSIEKINKMKILSVLGARPQFIKAAAVSRVIKETQGLKEVIVHTGQHFDKNMSDIFFSEMGIPNPDYMLNINSLSHGAMTGRMLEEVEVVIKKDASIYL